MAVEGSLDLFSLPQILQMISQQGKTGILTIQGQQDIVAVSFLAGMIVAADSLAHTVEEGLSKVLVSEGLLSAADVARANAEIHPTGGRLLDLLVERSYLTRQQLLAALRLQTIRQLEALVRWQEGDFKFYGGDEVSYEEGFEPIAVEDLLLRTLSDFSGSPLSPPSLPSKLPPSAVKPAALAPRTSDAASQPLPPVPQRTAPPVAWPAAAAAPVAAEQRSPAADFPAGTPREMPVPGTSTTATSVRRPGGRGEPDGGELRLPEIPELPEVRLPEPARADLPPASGEALRRPPQAPMAPAAPASPAAAPAAGAARTPRLVPAPVTSSASSPAAPAPAPGAGPAAEPVPWPAAAMSPPPSPAPARPRVAGPSTARPASLPGSRGAAGPLGRAEARPKKFRQMQVERPQVPLLDRLTAAGLALGLAALLVAIVRTAPNAVALPFPWEQGERNALLRNQRESLFNKIDGAAKTAFLRDGRFPDRLGQLADSGLLSPGDLDDPRGEPLLYGAREDSYTLQAAQSGKPVADAEASESTSGNFLLDPTLFQSSPGTGPPIVLLD